MKQIISYKTGTRAGNDAKALADCQFWLGKSFPVVVKSLANDLEDSATTRHGKLRHAHCLLSFVGIKGRYPVRAMVRAAAQVLR